jgi:hypothetical protein
MRLPVLYLADVFSQRPARIVGKVPAIEATMRGL